jgi:hypothetical protein
MRHRHLDVDPSTPVSELEAAALDDLLDRGDMDDWEPIVREVRRDPWGPVAERVLALVERHPMYGTTTLWRSWIEEQRAAAPAFHAGNALRQLRLSRRLTQLDVAERMGLSQPEVSKLERRRDVRVSTLLAYMRAAGAEPRLIAAFDADEVALE